MTPEERKAEFDPKQRYRLYQLDARRVGRDLVVLSDRQRWVAGAGAETPAGLGLMIVQLNEDGGEIDVALPLGILDTEPWERGEPGVWLANPHAGARVAKA